MARIVFSLHGLWLLLLCAPAQASIIMSHSTDGANLYAWAKAGYRGMNSAPLDFGTDTRSFPIGPPDAPSPFVRARKRVVPWSSTSVNDHLTVISRAHFAFDPAPDSPVSDRVTLVAKATGGAHDAHNRAGNPSRALVRTISSFQFQTDVPGPEPGALLAWVYMGALPRRDTYGTSAQAAVYEDGQLRGLTVSKGPGFWVPLMYGHAYELRLTYQGIIPYNDCRGLCVDQRREAPPHPLGVSVTAFVAPVPDPGADRLLCGGVMLMRRARSQRS